MLKGFDLLAYNEFKFNIPLLAIHPSGGGDFESGIDAALEAATRVEDPQWGKWPGGANINHIMHVVPFCCTIRVQNHLVQSLIIEVLVYVDMCRMTLLV